MNINSMGGGKVKSFPCETCSYIATQKGDLTRHVKSVHDKIRDHVCNECGKAFSEKKDMRKHDNAVHKKIKNFKCVKCPYIAA